MMWSAKDEWERKKKQFMYEMATGGDSREKLKYLMLHTNKHIKELE